MPLMTVIFIAIGLAMDAFAVSITSGLTIKHLKLRHAFVIATFFGGFQGVMPLLGWLGGATLRDYIGGVDHWIAFGLLVFIGGKMIYESTKMDNAAEEADPMNTYILFVLAIATSIDAFGVGLGFSLLNMTIFTPALIIAAITFILSIVGVYIGGRFGHLFEKKIEIAGGLIIISIGVKILAEHLLS